MTEFSAELVPILGWALLHFLWQGALIGLVAALALQLLRHARAQTRYAVACLALLACVLVPGVGVLMRIGTSTGASTFVAIATTQQAAVTAAPMTLDLAPWSSRIDQALPWIVALWAAGAGALSLRMAMGVLWIQRLRATPQGPAQAHWQARLDTLAARFGLRTGIALRLVDTLDSPASAGWWRPMVLLPAALLTRMPAGLIEALLAHELAHIRRHDYLVNLLQNVVEALLFYHPVTWWLSRRIRIERELIADQLAADATGEPRRLARALAELSELTHPCCPPPHLAQAAHGGHLMSRIEQLVRPTRRSSGGRIVFPVLGLAAVAIAFYANAQIHKDAPAAKASPQVVATTTPAKHVATSSRDAYALVRKNRDGVTMSGSTDDLPAIEAARHSLDGDFLWFRRGDRSYVVTDPGLLRRAEDAWRESNQLSAQMDALSREMDVHSDKLEALSSQMQQLSTRSEDHSAIDAASGRMETLAKHQQALASQHERLALAMIKNDEAGREQLSREMEALSDQQEALSQQMKQQSDVIEAEASRLQMNQQPMEELSQKMQVASQPMKALGKQMEALGDQQEKLVAQAEREMQKLVGEALDKGLAMPAPSYH